MLADEPSLKPGMFMLPDDPVATDVLIPGFRSATAVWGAFGWFTVGWIARLAPGLAEYLNRERVAPIRFTVSPRLFREEMNAVSRAQTMSEGEAYACLSRLFVDDRFEASALARHALDCLAWMVAENRLELKIAVAKAGSNYHPKIWLFDDGQQQLLARGSGNATDRGVFGGVEHLDVDVSWVDSSRARVAAGRKILDAWSQGRSQGIERVVDLPEALRLAIIETAPREAPRREDYIAAAAEDGSPPWAVEPWEQLREKISGRSSKAPRPRLLIPAWLNWEVGRFAHQKEAVDSWEGSSTEQRGTIAMATGAGKTVTALICATRHQRETEEEVPFVVVISVPSVPLIEQWKREVARFGVRALTPTLEPDPTASLTNFLRGIRSGGTHVVVVTHNMLCTSEFQAALELKCHGCRTLLIADEAHWLGAKGFLENRPDFFGARLALSATPERQHDPDGTEEVFEFFGPPVFEFGLDRAIGFCLTPYDYHVHACALDETEMADFAELSKRIQRALGGRDDADRQVPETVLKLALARQRIVETAESKIPLLRRVLERRGPRTLRHALIYASAKDPVQFQSVGAVLTDLGLRWAAVTHETTSRPRRFADIMKAFDEGGYQVLLAKRVLDEGVDLPSVREAFVVASSTVEREWIQRRGRVLRLHPGKTRAVLHDFLALPPAAVVREGDRHLRRLVRRELGRAFAFAGHARNAAGRSGTLATLRRLQEAFWRKKLTPEETMQRAGDVMIAPSMEGG